MYIQPQNNFNFSPPTTYLYKKQKTMEKTNLIKEKSLTYFCDIKSSLNYLINPEIDGLYNYGGIIIKYNHKTKEIEVHTLEYMVKLEQLPEKEWIDFFNEILSDKFKIKHFFNSRILNGIFINLLEKLPTTFEGDFLMDIENTIYDNYDSIFISETPLFEYVKKYDLLIINTTIINNGYWTNFLSDDFMKEQLIKKFNKEGFLLGNCFFFNKKTEEEVMKMLPLK